MYDVTLNVSAASNDKTKIELITLNIIKESGFLFSIVKKMLRQKRAKRRKKSQKMTHHTPRIKSTHYNFYK